MSVADLALVLVFLLGALGFVFVALRVRANNQLEREQEMLDASFRRAKRLDGSTDSRRR